MKKYLLIFTPLLFASCDDTTVPRAEYDAVVEYMMELEAENDSLQFEIGDLEIYNDYLERIIDSLQK